MATNKYRIRVAAVKDLEAIGLESRRLWGDERERLTTPKTWRSIELVHLLEPHHTPTF